jgi:hypothetical protein
MLFHAVWGVPRIRNEEYLRGMPFNGWELFRETLLAAADIAPDVMLGPMSWLVTKHLGPGYSDSKDRASFVEATAERLFGADQLLGVFGRSDVSAFRSRQTELVYRCVKQAVTDPRVRGGAPYPDGDQEDAEAD